MADTQPLSLEARCRVIVERASRAMGKIQRDGARGASNVTHQEIEAMAAMLNAYGMMSILPGQATPSDLLITIPHWGTIS